MRPLAAPRASASTSACPALALALALGLLAAAGLAAGAGARPRSDTRLDLMNSSLVRTTLGSLRGVVRPELGLRYFKGVPFAEPPVNALRWQPPVPVKPWVPAVLEADRHAPLCAQHIDTPPWETLKVNGWPVEDCLYLDVTTPLCAPDPGSTSKGWPVLLWIFGGGFYAGGLDDTMIDPRGITHRNRDVVVVRVAFRVGVFGQLGSRELQARSSDGSTGNYGLQDQRLAMASAKRAAKQQARRGYR